MKKMKVKFMKRVVEMTEMEKITDYTCDSDFIACYDKLMVNRDPFLKSVNGLYDTTIVQGYGTITVKHLRNVPPSTRDEAFDLRMRMTAYWKIVIKRMVDCVALQLRFMMQRTVDKEMEMEILNEVMVHGGGIEKMLDEPPSVAKKRARLQKSIGLFQESKEIIEQVMDDIVRHN